MYIKQITIENYKSFSTPHEVFFSPGFNVVVGANNAGKTALVEALSLKVENKPHLSQEIIRQKGDVVNIGASAVQIHFSVPMDEFRQFLWNNSPTFYIQKGRGERPEVATQRVMNAFSLPNISIKCKYQSGSLVLAKIEEMDSNNFQDLGLSLKLKEQESLPTNIGDNINVRSVQEFAAYKLANVLSTRIYFFRAERLNVGQYRSGNNSKLESDAKNLAQVLNFLQTSNSSKFDRLINLTKTIFPDIKHITVPPVDDENTVKIHLWYVDRSTERDDLALPLQESGTGVGQVLSILYAAINANSPHSIIIDEPQSFLHPMAIRKLFDILHHDFPQHQYIITTHSPVVVSAANPENIILLTKEGMVTKSKTIRPSEKVELQSLLFEVGARFSDVFGAENILWVEGVTEENTFPIIVSKILHKQLMGTAILGILNVGDLEGKHKALILRIYRKLSEGQALIPPAIGFVLDKEGRSDDEQQDLERESNNLIHFLPRRMYENYLINSEGIIAIISNLENFNNQPIDSNEIEKWIKENCLNQKYYKNNFTPNQESWIMHIHGAKLLKDLFNTFSENRYSYDKVRDGIKLTSWLIDNHPEELKEISDLLDTLLTNKV